ncbi:MAG: DNA/RNA nuclease SfsA [Rhodospirillaceae bacterium]|jgi:sugar fermentation stimulation protein A|nr:DNA/RNA nuclease SfsA [Rhodospirillaceae bacterium]MBT4589885.1 DNA/RNA nuclease SfsA [Rhodospirillaceae bacterium]MBT4940140.1 DNA/RNA nuclease SfsA [Rhodospirillaceae bacterium]MBT5941668.1 DNA/RNA nuclease SfsA [Rhodospirillaceae bacterium]MBT7267368.1 DNA/RNA nuclease SfsA [Rhodospirillaceae bacterium]
MNFPDPLIQGRLIKRYKRFLTDVELESGEVVVAHCANPGSMLSLLEEGAEVWLSPARNPARKLKYTWEMINIGGSLVGLNTALPNKIVQEAIEDGLIPELVGYDSLRPEVKYGKNSRIDILLEGENVPICYVEIKSVTMSRPEKGDNLAEFPDSVTARGTKHLQELSDQVAEGKRAVMLYLVQREDCNEFSVAADIDPAYAAGLKAAKLAGVETLCYGCSVSPEAINIARKLKITS